MKKNRFLSIFFVLVFCTYLLSACGDATSTDSTNDCPAGIVNIGIHDGFFSRLCGCAETTGSVAPTGSLVCTISVNNTVVFNYLGDKLNHQVTPVGTPGFNPGPVSFAYDSDSPKKHVVVFSAPGTYNFEDRYHPSLTGQIVVE